MITTLKHLWAHHRVLLLAFLLAVGVSGTFAVRSIAAAIYWMDPAHQDQQLAGWMTPRYVARSYQLPPDVLGEALFLVRGETPRRISLDRLAAENGITLEDLQASVDGAAAAWRAEQDKRP